MSTRLHLVGLMYISNMDKASSAGKPSTVKHSHVTWHAIVVLPWQEGSSIAFTSSMHAQSCHHPVFMSVSSCPGTIAAYVQFSKQHPAFAIHCWAHVALCNHLQTQREQHKEELDSQRQQYETALQSVRTAQVEAEERAASSAKEGMERKLREADSRCEALTDTVQELRMGLERQRAAADLRCGVDWKVI